MKKNQHILIVDDDRDFAESLSLYLQLDGIRTSLAFSGEEAVEIMGQEEFDLIFMDVKLPGMNGVESFFKIRKMKPHAKVMMMTAHSLHHLLSRALDGGALGILHKPFTMKKVQEALKEIEPEGVILLADQDKSFIEGMTDELEKKGYRALWVQDGECAMDLACSQTFDILVLDLKLPILSGLEVYLSLKEMGCCRPAILVTANPHESETVLQSIEEYSVSGCLIKPFNPEVLMDIINKELGNKELR